MQKIHFSIQIDAPKEKVWDAMLSEQTYPEWTNVFNPGSYYIGNWEQGSEMRFLGPNPDGNGEGGMFSRIKENRRYEFLSIEHLGMIQNGVIDTTSEKVKQWTPSLENYTFTEKDGGTEVSVDMDVAEEYKAMFEDMWPKALQMLKELTERE